MKWVRERDLLIAQTMAFVQSVSGMKPVKEVLLKTGAEKELPAAEVEGLVQVVLNHAQDQQVVQPPRITALPSKDLRQEIQSRVASFRAHQQRFHKERDSYYVSTMAQLRASSKNSDLPSDRLSI